MKSKSVVLFVAIGCSAYAGIALAPGGGIEPGQSANEYAEEIAREWETLNTQAENADPRDESFNEVCEQANRDTEEFARETESPSGD